MASRLGPLGERFAALPRLLVAAVVAMVIVAGAVTFWPDAPKRYVTVEFPRTVSLYEGSDLRVLGVKIGEVESVTPTGTTVSVRMSYDAEVKVPDDARAVIVSPAVVGDRFVQLTPAYTEGAVLADGETLDEARAATPVELDEIYQSIDDLSVALGPRGANSQGSLSRLLDASAENFDGNGAQLRQTIRDLALLTGTLSNNKEELFGSLQQVSRFVHALAENDSAVRRFNASLAGVSTVLEGERDDLAAALDALGRALGDVQGFVERNEELIASNVQGLSRVTRVLVRQRDALTDALDVAPTALTNLGVAYNEGTGTLDQRTNLLENLEIGADDPALLLCTLLNESEQDELCGVLTDVLDDGNLPDLPPLPRARPFGTDGQQRPVEVEHVDPTLGGLAP